MEEIWKSIDGYPAYEVSNLGRVRSYFLKGRISKVSDEPQRILKGGRTKCSYWVVTLIGDSGPRTRFIHQLVAEAFIGPRPEGYFVCHKDDNKDDNRASNLCYGTPQDNTNQAIENGVEFGRPKKLSEQEVVEIRNARIKGVETNSEIAQRYNVSVVMVQKIGTGKRYADIDGPIKKYKRHTGKISNRQIKEIKALRKEGWTLMEIAQKYRVSESYVSLLVRGLRK